MSLGNGRQRSGFYGAAWVGYIFAVLSLIFGASQVAPDGLRRISAASLIFIAGAAAAAAYHFRRIRIVLTAVAIIAIVSALPIVLLPSGKKDGQAYDSSKGWVCPTQDRVARIELSPAAAKKGAHVNIAGDGFPSDTVVDISLRGQAPSQPTAQDDIASVRTDACGKFNQGWTVPDSIPNGYTAVEIVAEAKLSSPPGDRLCCHDDATLQLTKSN